ncbi:hypothetical protein H2248_006977 [Termitomyces sp. 'cryptogamus']|nr:hypothetical protein H2248_006977 [Termitomyces sp. 'cryptogamus']
MLERCRSLTVRAESRPEVSILSALHHLTHRSMPVLEDLSLDIRSVGFCDIADSSSPHTILSGGAPRLRFLQMQGCTVQPHVLPLAGLTTVYIHHINTHNLWTCDELFMFLEQLTSLERLSLQGYPINLGVYTGRICLPTLRELRLRPCSQGTDYPKFWYPIDVPNLETLHLYDCKRRHNPQFWRDSSKSPKLMHLIIESSQPEILESWDKGRSIIMELASSFPSVRHL